MTIENAKILLKFVERKTQKDDKFCCFYFSREDDQYTGETNIDGGEALIIIKDLIEKFNLDQNLIAQMD